MAAVVRSFSYCPKLLSAQTSKYTASLRVFPETQSSAAHCCSYKHALKRSRVNFLIVSISNSGVDKKCWSRMLEVTEPWIDRWKSTAFKDWLSQRVKSFIGDYYFLQPYRISSLMRQGLMVFDAKAFRWSRGRAYNYPSCVSTLLDFEAFRKGINKYPCYKYAPNKTSPLKQLTHAEQCFF